jgi:Rrf2 family protein
MKISAKADYAVRALIELAAAEKGVPVTAEAIAAEQAIPMPFLETILSELRQSDMVQSNPDVEGGYLLSTHPEDVSIADVIRAVEGPLATVRGEHPKELRYQGSAEPLATVWIALRSNVRHLLEGVTVADVVAGQLPADIASFGASLPPAQADTANS